MYFIDIIVQSNANGYMALMFKLTSPLKKIRFKILGSKKKYFNRGTSITLEILVESI